MQNKVFGLDLAKSVFHAIDQHGQRKKLRRHTLLPFFATQEKCVIAMESCSSAHHWGRALKGLGHEVMLLPPQHIKAWLRGQKNDFNDARALMEAALAGRIRSVPVKTVRQQDEQVLLRTRQQLISERTRLVNQLRAVLVEYGIVMPVGVRTVHSKVPLILEDADNGLGPLPRSIIARHYERLVFLGEELTFYDRAIEEQVQASEVCQRLKALPGIGSLTSYALKNWIGSGQQFRRGRDASAALGVVPRQYSTGDKQVLLGITKKGDASLRSLLIHGARAVASHARKKDDPLSRWVARLIDRRGYNKAVVALANKLIRMAWVIVARGEAYRPATA